jgi:hypothetical protein
MLTSLATADQNLALSPQTMRELGREEEGIKLPNGNYFGSIMVWLLFIAHSPIVGKMLLDLHWTEIHRKRSTMLISHL